MLKNGNKQYVFLGKVDFLPLGNKLANLFFHFDDLMRIMVQLG